MSRYDDDTLWRRITAQVKREWQDLPADEKGWIAVHAGRIADLQEELHRLFLAADGARACRDCRGDCCGHGRFHPTLANLLALLVREVPFPQPDFTAGCPYMGETGCRFAPGFRPYNCITFICDRIEARLGPDECREFYRLEQRVRQEYQAVAGRYAGGTLRGLLVRGEALPAYLARRVPADPEDGGRSPDYVELPAGGPGCR